MNVINFLLANWDSVIVVLVFIVFIVFLIIKGEKNIVYKIAFALVTEAEKQYGGGTGKFKQSAVINWVYERLPAVIKIFISAATLGKWVDDVVEQAKAEWAKNANIKDYIESGTTDKPPNENNE